MGGLLHLVQREGDWRGHRPPRPLFAVPNVTAHPSTASVPTSYYSMWYYRQACTKRSHAGIVFTQWSKNGFFRPAVATHCPDKREIWHGEPTFVTPCQISRLSGQKCGNTAPKIVKISNFGHKFAHPGRRVALILRNSQHLYASISSF